MYFDQFNPSVKNILAKDKLLDMEIEEGVDIIKKSQI